MHHTLETISDSQADAPAGLLPITTLAIWLLAFAIGVGGFLLSYPGPKPRAAPPLPPTQLVNVELPKIAPPPPPQPEPPAPVPAVNPTSAPPLPQPIIAAQAPPLAVAQPTPSLAFALPVEGLTRIVDVNQAAHARPIQTAAAGTGSSAAPPRPAVPQAPAAPPAAAPPVTHLTLGEGEGNQPAPEYPREAILARQQGDVGLRFTVNSAGRVTAVEVIAPSRFSLLNQAATRTVKERWQFTPGAQRSYEVTIQFQLNQ
jgi:protein TonB